MQHRAVRVWPKEWFPLIENRSGDGAAYPCHAGPLTHLSLHGEFALSPPPPEIPVDAVCDAGGGSLGGVAGEMGVAGGGLDLVIWN